MTSKVTVVPAGLDVDARGDARHADVADSSTVRDGAPHLDARVERRPERARQEVERQQPAIALPDRRLRQRHEPAGDRDDRLIGRDDDRARAGGERDAAGQLILARGEAERLRQIVERDVFLIVER